MLCVSSILKYSFSLYIKKSTIKLIHFIHMDLFLIFNRKQHGSWVSVKSDWILDSLVYLDLKKKKFWITVLTGAELLDQLNSINLVPFDLSIWNGKDFTSNEIVVILLLHAIIQTDLCILRVANTHLLRIK